MNATIIISTIISSIAYLGLISLLLIPFAYLWFLSKNQYWKKRGLNGPTVIPIIGNNFNPFKPIPKLQIEQVNKYGRFFGMFSGKTPVVCVSDPTVIKKILVKDFPIFRNRVNSRNSNTIASKNLVAVRDETWKRIRSILSPMFTTSKLKKMEPLIGQCVDSMINALDSKANGNKESNGHANGHVANGKVKENDSTFHVHSVMGNFTMDVISKCAFATDTDAHQSTENQFVKSAKQVFNFSVGRALLIMIFPNFVTNLLNKIRLPFFYVPGNDFFIDISRHLVRQRREDPSKHADDMLQLMVKAEFGKDGKSFEKEDEFDAHHVNVGKEELEQEEKLMKEIIGSKYLDEDEIIAQSMVFFLAGYETTASTLTFCLYHLAKNKDIQTKLYEEIKTILDAGEKLEYKNVMTLKYLDAVISETLRICPPALGLSREAAEKYYIEEYDFQMEKGDGVFIPVYAIHHDEEFYKEPEKFDPERFMPENRDKIIPYTYLPFGGGPRNCIGMRFALSEAKLGLAKMITQFEFFPTEKTPKKLDVEMSLFILKTTPIYIGIKRRN